MLDISTYKTYVAYNGCIMNSTKCMSFKAIRFLLIKENSGSRSNKLFTNDHPPVLNSASTKRNFWLSKYWKSNNINNFQLMYLNWLKKLQHIIKKKIHTRSSALFISSFSSASLSLLILTIIDFLAYSLASWSSRSHSLWITRSSGVS